jgi:DNA (cytosine-5)-methyltransferase 1
MTRNRLSDLLRHRARVAPSPFCLESDDLNVRPMIIDCFAGGGGASTGIEAALGRGPDVAINHSAPALALHAANHPDTVHLDSNIWDVEPVSVTQGRPVGLLWASPDCKHFSKAKGGAPKDRNIRDLAWVVVRWAEESKPDVILLENVEEFRTWGPIGNDGQPIKELAGIEFERWSRRLRQAGYRMQWRELRACDYGAPTIRKRFFMIARRDGRRIVWPKPTHGDPASDAVRRGRLKPWRTAAECIDWSLPCPSIFDTGPEIMARHGLRAVRPLAANTLARVARGMNRYVLEAERPFIVNTANGQTTGRGPNHWTAEEPLRTVTAAHGFALIAPSLTRFNGGATGSDLRDPAPTVTANSWIRKPGGAAPLGIIAPVLTYAQQGGRSRDVAAPHHTICASSKDQNSLIAAGLVHIGNGERAGQAPRALDVQRPLGTVVAAGPRQYPFAAYLAQQNGGPRMGAHPGHSPADPLSTVTAAGSQQTPVAAFFAKYYGTGDGARHDEPAHTVTTRDRFAHAQAQLAAPPFGPEHHARAREVAAFLRAHDAWSGGEFVTLVVDGAEFVVVDIGLRMLTPRELFNAQGFPPDYVIEGVWDGLDTEAPSFRAFPKDVQISCCGNSVCPPLAQELVRANCDHLAADSADQRGAHAAAAKRTGAR